MVLPMSTVMSGELSILYFCHNSPVITVGIRTYPICAGLENQNELTSLHGDPEGVVAKIKIEPRRRWNRTTELLHPYRFEVCTPHQRGSSTQMNFQQILFVWGLAGIEPATSRTLNENHTTRPQALDHIISPTQCPAAGQHHHQRRQK